jgi:signal transduction histidine kinase
MDLRPSTLDDLGILATISWFTREFSAIYSTITIEKRIVVEEEEIPVPLKTVIFRILQEALHNAAKYSRAEHILLSLEEMDRRIVLLIEDKGVGFDVEKVLAEKNNLQGIGLASMRERALLAGGTFSIKTAPGQGTSICAMWPLADRK